VYGVRITDLLPDEEPVERHAVALTVEVAGTEAEVAVLAAALAGARIVAAVLEADAG
jgi:hypothetical protein